MNNEKITLPNSSYSKIDRVSSILNTTSKSEAVEQCINLAEKLMTQMHRGGSVYYETRKGKSFELLLPGDG
jgi:hypothetical protein